MRVMTAESGGSCAPASTATPHAAAPAAASTTAAATTSTARRRYSRARLRLFPCFMRHPSLETGGKKRVPA